MRILPAGRLAGERMMKMTENSGDLFEKSHSLSADTAAINEETGDSSSLLSEELETEMEKKEESETKDGNSDLDSDLDSDLAEEMESELEIGEESTSDELSGLHMAGEGWSWSLSGGLEFESPDSRAGAEAGKETEMETEIKAKISSYEEKLKRKAEDTARGVFLSVLISSLRENPLKLAGMYAGTGAGVISHRVSLIEKACDAVEGSLAAESKEAGIREKREVRSCLLMGGVLRKAVDDVFISDFLSFIPYWETGIDLGMGVLDEVRNWSEFVKEFARSLPRSFSQNCFCGQPVSISKEQFESMIGQIRLPRRI